MPKLGDIHPETGLIFWSKRHNWLTQDQFDSYKRSHRRAALKIRSKTREKYKNASPEEVEARKKKRHEIYLRHKQMYVLAAKEWAKNNPEKKKKISRKSHKKRLKTNNLFRLRVNVGNRVKCALRRKGIKNRTSTIKLLGCSVHELMEHLQSKFKPGMNWNNWAPKGWHVDHIKPLALAKNIEELETLCHFTNLQPLWWHENMSKGSKFTEEEVKVGVV